ncbi:hypothetical protein [Chondromyces apiculatus]|uniref:Uncharacterized protein n=1 Tax=Chondromyces apiculatus DSM 436 TaxID=1192034 RepID=A0A017T1J7_9BACT|nr:hypothetical protein [Chondromyces apiculatus]EYF03073.1 Hypothetical protein CAP_6187 [Chondromyces apiculatus DSM 436]
MALLTTRIVESMKHDPWGIPSALRGRDLASAYLGVIGWWLEVGINPPSKQMAAWL